MGKKILSAIILVLSLVLVLSSCNDDGNISSEVKTTQKEEITTEEKSTKKEENTTVTEDAGHTHSFDEWEIVKAATCTTEGVKERYCSCGEKQSVSISITEHKYVNSICSVCGGAENGALVEGTDNEKYGVACEFIAAGKYTEAYAILLQLKDYEPAVEKLGNFFYAPTVVKEGNYNFADGKISYEEMNVEYDFSGNIKSITFPEDNITVNYIYDSKGNELEGYNLAYPNSSGAHHTCSYKNGKLSKVVYDGYTDEYYYNEDYTINKVVRTESYDGNTNVIEGNYTYTYYSDGAIKTMRYFNVELWGAYEYEYDTNSNIVKINRYDSAFTECYAYIDLEYNDYGLSKVEFYYVGEKEALYEIIYSYDNSGKLVEATINESGDLYAVSLFSDYQLCYSENPSAKERVDTISILTPERILSFFE